MSYESTVQKSTQVLQEATDKLEKLTDFHKLLEAATAGTQSAGIAHQINQSIETLKKATQKLSADLGKMRQHHHNFVEKPPSDTTLFDKGKAIAQGLPGVVKHPVKFVKTLEMVHEQKQDVGKTLDEYIKNCKSSIKNLKSVMDDKLISEANITNLASKFLARDRTWTIS